MRGVTWSMSQNWTICVRYTAHPGMIAAVPYTAGRLWIVLLAPPPDGDSAGARVRGLGPGLTSDSADPRSCFSSKRSVGRAPGFLGTHRHCRSDLPGL